MGFTKLFSQILDSTIWDQPWEVKGVWVTLLAMADSHGRVLASVPGLARRATVTLEQVEAALAIFISPDKYSRTPDHDGRRIEIIDGGWRLLNYRKYREMRDEDARKDYQKEWVKEKRRQKVSTVDQEKPQSTQAEAEAEAEVKELLCDPTPRATAPAPVSLPNAAREISRPDLLEQVRAFWPTIQPGTRDKAVPKTVPKTLRERWARACKPHGAEVLMLQLWFYVQDCQANGHFLAAPQNALSRGMHEEYLQAAIEENLRQQSSQHPSEPNAEREKGYIPTSGPSNGLPLPFGQTDENLALSGQFLKVGS